MDNPTVQVKLLQSTPPRPKVSPDGAKGQTKGTQARTTTGFLMGGLIWKCHRRVNNKHVCIEWVTFTFKGKLHEHQMVREGLKWVSNSGLSPASGRKSASKGVAGRVKTCGPCQGRERPVMSQERSAAMCTCNYMYVWPCVHVLHVRVATCTRSARTCRCCAPRVSVSHHQAHSFLGLKSCPYTGVMVPMVVS